jgi:hypothetical protein
MGSVPAVPLLPEEVSLLPSLEPGLLAVQVAEAPAVEVLVNLRRGEAGQHLLAEGVVLHDALPLAVMLVHAHCLETSCAREQFVGDVVVAEAAAVHLVVSALGAEHVKQSHIPEHSLTSGAASDNRQIALVCLRCRVFPR